MKKTIIILAYLLLFNYSGYAQVPFDDFPRKKYYTIEIERFERTYNTQTRMGNYKEQKLKCIDSYMKNINEGKLVYYQYKESDESKSYYLYRGIFPSITEAQLWVSLHLEKDTEVNVVETDVYVEQYKDEFFVITTPQNIWYLKDNKYESLYALPNSTDQNFHLNTYSYRARISPNGKKLLFFTSDIVILDIESKQKQILVENNKPGYFTLLRSIPKWSPSGEKVAFIDRLQWESGSNVWVINSDGSDLKKLIKPKDQCKIKHISWHPTKEKILYCEGYAFGTVSVGGSIYITDLMGNKKLIIAPEEGKRQEISSYFEIIGNKLYYHVVQYDEQYMRREYTLKTLDISKIK